MGNIPLPALSLNQVENPLDSLAKVYSLKNMLAQQKTNELQQTAMSQENQQRQMALDDATGLKKALADSGGDWDVLKNNIKNPKYGVSVQGQLGFQDKLLQHDKEMYEHDTARLTNEQKKSDKLVQTLQPILGMKNADGTPDEAGMKGAWTKALNKNLIDGTISKDEAAQFSDFPGVDAAKTILAQHTLASTQMENIFKERKANTDAWKPDGSGNMVNTETGKALPLANPVPIPQDLAERLGNPSLGGKPTSAHQLSQLSEAAQSLVKNQPLTAMETDPSHFDAEKLPGSIAYLTTTINNPAATQQDKDRASRLLKTANVAKNVVQQMDASKKAAEQAVSQGSPTDAAQLLVDGNATLSELKARGSTTQFITQTLSEANRLSGGKYNAQKAEADFKVAGSPSNLAFFGSANSLTDKGGTLDQLNEAAKDIPGGRIPVFNSIADATLAATGSGPVAKYASLLLGVADDYSKVMGGGQGSDASRGAALKLVPENASPVAREAAIQGIRGAVTSQREARIGNNPVMRKMYGGTASTEGAKTLSLAQVQQAAKDHNVSVEEAIKQAKLGGYTVQ